MFNSSLSALGVRVHPRNSSHEFDMEHPRPGLMNTPHSVIDFPNFRASVLLTLSFSCQTFRGVQLASATFPFLPGLGPIVIHFCLSNRRALCYFPSQTTQLVQILSCSLVPNPCGVLAISKAGDILATVYTSSQSLGKRFFDL